MARASLLDAGLRAFLAEGRAYLSATAPAAR